MQIQRYKLIYWYNEDFGLEGARPADPDHKEWELFDCEADPHELTNVAHDPAYAGIFKTMLASVDHDLVVVQHQTVQER